MGNFTLYINSKSQTHICDNSSSNNYDYDNDNEEKHCAPMDFVIHLFWMFLKKWITRIQYSLLPQVKNFIFIF